MDAVADGATDTAETLQVRFSVGAGSVTEGMVVRWRKHVGERVGAGEVIVDVTTDKVDLEVWTVPDRVHSPAEGVLSRIVVQAGQTILVGASLAELLVEQDGDEFPQHEFAARIFVPSGQNVFATPNPLARRESEVLMNNRLAGTTLEELCNDSPEAGEALREQIGAGERVDMYVVGKDSDVLALTARSLYIIRPGLQRRSRATAVGYPYNTVSQVAVHASKRDFVLELQAKGALEHADPAAARDDRSGKATSVHLDETDLPAFEGVLALLLERVAKAGHDG